jgi:hypothetical protein
MEATGTLLKAISKNPLRETNYTGAAQFLGLLPVSQYTTPLFKFRKLLLHLKKVV